MYLELIIFCLVSQLLWDGANYMCNNAEKAQIHKWVWSTNGPVNGLRSLKSHFSPLPPPFQMPVEAYFSKQYPHCDLTQKHRTLLDDLTTLLSHVKTARIILTLFLISQILASNARIQISHCCRRRGKEACQRVVKHLISACCCGVTVVVHLKIKPKTKKWIDFSSRLYSLFFSK